jgi:hypothetical protein
MWLVNHFRHHAVGGAVGIALALHVSGGQLGIPASQVARLVHHFDVADPRLQLLSIDQRFVLRLSCRAGFVSRLEVTGRYVYSADYPEWRLRSERPLMDAQTFQKILEAIDSATPLGPRTVGFGGGPRVAGSTFAYSQYRDAFIHLERRSVDPFEALAFSVWFYRPVSGVVSDLISPIEGWNTPGVVVIDGKRFYVREDALARLRVGSRAAHIPAAGPLGENQRRDPAQQCPLRTAGGP